MDQIDTAEQLVRRLYDAADELASAARYGLTVPASVSISGYERQGLMLILDTVDEFDTWADYATNATTQEYDHDGAHWHSGVGDLNGLLVTFAVKTPLPAEVTP